MKFDKIKTRALLEMIQNDYIEEQKQYKYRVLVCTGAGCISSNCTAIRDTVLAELKKTNMQDDVKVYETGCMGTCAVGPVMLVLPDRNHSNSWITDLRCTSLVVSKGNPSCRSSRIWCPNFDKVPVPVRSVFK